MGRQRALANPHRGFLIDSITKYLTEDGYITGQEHQMMPYRVPLPYRCAMTDEQLRAQVFPNRFPEAVDSGPG
ncbi:hypothetical protein ABZ646_24175 [Streptomyces sp. NPDC007162]|uniref:hypothetical protein n=1 Tax=Streptomyces sp. NPDC007162 TaxID=3156917 RepID=UPI0033DE78FD